MGLLVAVFGPHLQDPFAANTCKKCNGSHCRFPCDVINQNKKFTNPSEVLVLTHVRPSNNLTFCNVSTRQGSSLSNRARLNFQVYALLDIKTADGYGSRAAEKRLLRFLPAKEVLL